MMGLKDLKDLKDFLTINIIYFRPDSQYSILPYRWHETYSPAEFSGINLRLLLQMSHNAAYSANSAIPKGFKL
ncbi:MAG: hypothetical protein C0611_04385 [Desulfobacteraceae bacterium]|nr:MAG: hypothetical protein C0611_04385 [Desulfobacteraceae bacterium]